MQAGPLIPVPWWQGVASSLDSSAVALAEWLGGVFVGVGFCLLLLVLVVILRLATRKVLVADVLASILLALATNALFAGPGWSLAAGVAFLTINSTIWIWLLRRFGFLTMFIVWIIVVPATGLPLQTTGWVAGRSLPLYLVPAAMAAWALWVILSAQRRPLTDSTV